MSDSDTIAPSHLAGHFDNSAEPVVVVGAARIIDGVPMSLLVSAATILTSLISLLSSIGRPAPQPISPSQALVAWPSSAVRGTMLMVHGGGWQGPGPVSQKAVMALSGDTLSQRGWRVVSIDYHAGAAGLQDVLDAAGSELAQPTGDPLCIYGESGGAQLALVAASLLPEIDCVIGFAPPAAFEAYLTEVRASRDPERQLVADQIAAVWGPTPAARAPYDPIKVARSISADVLLMRAADDPLIPAAQIDHFVAARPTTQRLELESASTTAHSEYHGTLSDNGRNQYRAALGSIVDRAAAAHDAERSAERTGCKDVTGSVTQVGVARVQSALRCLARADKLARNAGAARAMTTSRRIRGEVDAARAWHLLRTSVRGRRALAALTTGHATTTIRIGDPTRVTLRIRR